MAKSSKDSKALVKQGNQSMARVAWNHYKHFHPAVRVVIPSFLAIGAITWAGNVLSQDEYGVALLLVVLFVVFGLAALRQCAIPSRTLNIIIALIVVSVGFYSVGVIWKKRGGKAWTTLWSSSRLVENKPSPLALTPTPPIEEKPKLEARIDHYSVGRDEHRKQPNSVITLVVDVRNNGVPSIAEEWHLKVALADGRTLPALGLALPTGFVILNRDSGEPKVFAGADSLIEKTYRKEITKGPPVKGALLFVVDGVTREEVWREGTLFILTFRDRTRLQYTAIEPLRPESKVSHVPYWPGIENPPPPKRRRR